MLGSGVITDLRVAGGGVYDDTRVFLFWPSRTSTTR